MKNRMIGRWWWVIAVTSALGFSATPDFTAYTGGEK
jgi:hypothetical protein